MDGNENAREKLHGKPPEKAKGKAALGAAFIMATSAIGPGFLTQTAKFTGDFQGSFGFVILVSLLLSAVVQLNVWRVLCISGMRGQDTANSLIPGLGYVIAALIVLGGLVFNIGNVGGGALGANALANIPQGAGCIITGAAAVTVFLVKNAAKAMDAMTKVLGAVMIGVILLVLFIVRPPIGLALKEAVLPSADIRQLFPAVLTLLGGTVGGYITFAGAHRLIDAGITGKENQREISKSALTGMQIAAVMRVLLFLAILGVTVSGAALDAANPAADAFRKGAGELGYRIFGLVLFCAAVTSTAGAAYTSVSFLKTLSRTVRENEKWFTVGFIGLSTLIMLAAGQPAKLLVLAGALNGLILPLTLGVCLAAAGKKSVMGPDYRHPLWLYIAGVLVLLLLVYMAADSLGSLWGNI